MRVPAPLAGGVLGVLGGIEGASSVGALLESVHAMVASAGTLPPVPTRAFTLMVR
jgi:hypothetical protein